MENRKIEVTARLEDELNGGLVIFELIGLQYFSLKTLTRENMMQRPSVIRTIYMLILLVAFTALISFFIMMDNEIERENITAKNVLMLAIHHSMNVGFILITWTSLIQSFNSTQNVKRFFFNLKDILELYKTEFDVTLNYKRIKKTLWKRFAKMISFFLIVHVGTSVWHLRSYYDLFHMLIAMLPVLFLLMIIYKFMFYVNVVNRHLKFMGSLLEKSFSNQTKPNEVIPVKQLSSPEDPIRKLKAARKVYNLLYDNGMLVNESFGLTILIFLMMLVTNLTVSGYQIFVIVVGGLSLDQIPSKYVI